LVSFATSTSAPAPSVGGPALTYDTPLLHNPTKKGPITKPAANKQLLLKGRRQKWQGILFLGDDDAIKF